jgi:hypothetical protein
VGAERENLEKERREELARRVHEYKATMAIMKKPGALRPGGRSQPKESQLRSCRCRSSQRDSWFEYLFPSSAAVSSRLEALGV